MGKREQGELLHRRECESVSKEEAAEYLRGLGYNAVVDDGLVLILLNEIPTSQESFKILTHLREIGYRSSWGWKKIQGGK